MNSKREALILGATGLIGTYLTEEISKNSDYKSVTTLVRNPTEKNYEKFNEVVIDFDELVRFSNNFKVDDVFICLGTTRKQAGSQENFKKVDQDFVVEAASLASENGVTRIAIVSAIGADSTSRFFYNKVKGDMEEAVKEQGIPSTYFFRPSLLVGERKDFRAGERIGEALGRVIRPLLKGKLQKYRSVHGRTVAKAMIKFMKNSKAGVHVVESDMIEKIGSL